MVSSLWHIMRQGFWEHLFLLTYLKIAAPLRTDLNTAISHLSSSSAHDVLILMKMSFSAPKVLHTLCCSLCVNHPCLEMFDILLRKSISIICNFDFPDHQWLQRRVCIVFPCWHLPLFYLLSQQPIHSSKSY